MNGFDPHPGDWVKVTAKVIELHPNGDLGVELFSKTDQYSTPVRRDLCEPTDKPIPEEPADGSVVVVAGFAYQRHNNQWWAADDDAVGRTWLHLHRLGDVEVIHHG